MDDSNVVGVQSDASHEEPAESSNSSSNSFGSAASIIEKFGQRAANPPTEQVDPMLGCKHYRRKCKLVSPCCDNVYPCRFCHDEAEGNHTLERKHLKEVVCNRCSHRQPIQQICEGCGLVMGNYYCSTCRLFDDEDKQHFHCDGCGICRIGGKDKFFHCPRCDMCLPLRLKGNHKCVENMSRIDCPVCLEYIHTSRIPSQIPPCGHLIHRTCFEELLRAGLYACPICNAALVNMERVWRQLDREVAETPMPDEYKNLHVDILCRDCHAYTKVLYHVLGLKCQSCGSYNTTRTAPPRRALSSASCTSSSSTSTSSDGLSPGGGNISSAPIRNADVSAASASSNAERWEGGGNQSPRSGLASVSDPGVPRDRSPPRSSDEALRRVTRSQTRRGLFEARAHGRPQVSRSASSPSLDPMDLDAE
ncbi:unnamed protein product [Cyprideis torosa]|uniref:Uncharacterized protein n=1 Tax=Cyprideis torosa TaxID=163714 RepID=A0A7R8ZH87_9CRUS|nr:unnamed protein product [Cyprideis torosa]CAG0881992.1 unnamed protein product [Cyprideis torosa]